MNGDKDNEQFIPETVDEQVEAFLQMRDQHYFRTHPNARLTHDLAITHQENNQILERAWQRLSTQPGVTQAPAHPPSIQYERTQHMYPNDNRPQRRQSRKRQTLLVASLVVLLLVGSSLAIFSFLRPHSGQTLITPNLATNTTSVATQKPTPSPTAIPQVQTSCPADGARAAIMPPILVGNQGKDQSIIYTYIEQSSTFTSMLKKYDVTTGKKTNILKTASLIDYAQISNDGQWIIFVTGTAHGKSDSAIQLVRIDGQELQTLSCFSGFTTTLAWSSDQKYLAFNSTGVGLYLLDMTSGKLQLLLRDSTGYDYRPMKWSNNTDLYVTRFIENTQVQLNAGDGLGGTLGHNELYLLRNVTSIASLQSTNPTQITIPTIPGASGDECQDFDVSPDNTHLLYSDCHVQITPDPPQSDTISYTGPSTIASQLLSGGPSNTIYQDTAHGIHYARYINDSTILFVGSNTIMDTNTQGGLWKINTDGSGLTQLVSTQSTAQAKDFILDLEKLNVPGYRPWFSVSPDGTMFALGIAHSSSHDMESLLFGSLNGGSTTTFATTDVLDSQKNVYSVSLVGWSTINTR